jgi:hypothetical protein
MRTCLAVSSHLSAKHVDETVLKFRLAVYRGYVLPIRIPARPQSAKPFSGEGQWHEDRNHLLGCVRGACVWRRSSQRFSMRICFSVMRPKPARFPAPYGGRSIPKLKNQLRSVVVTNGPMAPYIRHAGVEAHVPAFPSEPKDLTGAGDMFAGSFLYGITHGVSPEKAARTASFLSHKVISQVGARLHHGTKSSWDGCLAKL